MRGSVELGELGPLEAWINVALCGQFAVVRFARSEAEAIVQFCQRRGVLLMSGVETPVQAEWDGEAIVLTTPFYIGEDGGPETVRVEPGEDGLWAVDAGDWGWKIVTEQWPQRQEVTAALMAGRRVGQLARRLRQARVVLDNTATRDREAWKTAHRRRDQRERAFRRVLTRSGVPIGHLHQVFIEVYDAAGATLVHSGMVVPQPYPRVTDMESVPTSRGVAYVAQVEFRGVPFGTFEDEGMGGDLRFEPAGPDYRGPLAEMEAFADACLHPDEYDGREMAYSHLITEWEVGQIVADFPADGDRTVLRIEAGDEVEYQPIDRKPSQMQLVMRARLGGELGDLVRRATRVRYWTGAQWRPVTIIEA